MLVSVKCERYCYGMYWYIIGIIDDVDDEVSETEIQTMLSRHHRRRLNKEVVLYIIQVFSYNSTVNYYIIF